jgi:hypothetical protein
LKNLNPKLIEFKSFQNSLKIEVKTILDESLKEEDLTNDHKEIQVHVYEIIGETSISEEEITKDREPIMNILLNNPTFRNTENGKQLSFESKNWLDADKTYLFKPISKKYLFKPSFTKFKLDSVNSNFNSITLNANLGLFIKGIITPSDVEGVEINLKSIDNSTKYSKIINSEQGFYFGPFESENLFLKYRIELIKQNYLFKLLS